MLQGVVDLVVNCGLENIIELNELDLLCVFYAAVIHDFKHPGFNNGYLINTKSDLAFLYNDKSCLENYHIAEAFKILKLPNRDIFEKFEPNDFKLLRKRVIEGVLATDMMSHSKLIGIMTSRLYLQYKEADKLLPLAQILLENKELNKIDLQQDYINFIIHAVDIGHGAKPFDLEVKWAEMVTKEFHNQGDKERELGLAISFLCDRNTSNLPASQVGFLSGIVLPTFQLVYKLLPESKEYVDMLLTSKEEWDKLNKK